MTLELPPNPYEVLGVPMTASNQEIAAAMASAIKAKKYPPQVIAEAQRTLLDPQRRLLANFFLPMLPTVHRWRRFDLSELDSAEVVMEPLSEYDGLEDAIAELKDLLKDE